MRHLEPSIAHQCKSDRNDSSAGRRGGSNFRRRSSAAGKTILKSSAAGDDGKMALSITIAVDQVGRAWRSEGDASNVRDEDSPNEEPMPTATDAVVAVDKENQMEVHNTLKYSQPRLTAAAVHLVSRAALAGCPPTFSTSAAEVVPAGEEAAMEIQKQQRRQRQHSPLGCLFHPELDKAEVISIVSEVVCRPGFTLGPRDERRLLQSVRTGRVDVRCMSRLLRWLAGERVARELKKQGVEFVGPKGLRAAEPYTTGQGMQRLVQEVIASGHPTGTRFIVCFSSRFDACSSAIAGLLVDASCPISESISEFSGLEPSSHVACGGFGGGGALSEATRTPSTCSWSSDTDDDVTPSLLRSPTGAVVAAATAMERVNAGTAAGAAFAADRETRSSSSNSRGSSIRGESAEDRQGDVVALLLDEIPKHCRRAGVSADGRGLTSGCVADESGGRVYGMRVEKWVEAYGECDGPMLAAWVFLGKNHL